VLTQGNTDQTLANLLDRANPVLRAWANYFRHGVSARTFSYLSAFSWRRVVDLQPPDYLVDHDNLSMERLHKADALLDV